MKNDDKRQLQDDINYLLPENMRKNISVSSNKGLPLPKLYLYIGLLYASQSWPEPAQSKSMIEYDSLKDSVKSQYSNNTLVKPHTTRLSTK